MDDARVETSSENDPDSAGPVQVIPLASGTTVSVRSDPQGESIVVRAAGGKLELSIRMTDAGPVLSLKGVRLELEAADSVAVNCREFAVNAREAVRLESAGDVQVRSDAEIRLRSAGDTYVDADYVKLNCLDREGYHDYVPDSKDAVESGEAKGELHPRRRITPDPRNLDHSTD